MISTRYKNDRSKQKASQLISHFTATTTINDKGNISFGSLDFEGVFLLASELFSFPEELAGREAYSLTRQTILALRKIEKLTVQSLEQELKQKSRLALKQHEKRYTAWTKFRTRSSQFSKSYRVKANYSNLQISPTLPGWLRLEEYFVSGIGDINPFEPNGFGFLIGRVNARNRIHAAKLLFEDFDIFLGLANIHRRYGTWSAWANMNQPDGEYWLGPRQFFWEEKKFLNNDHIWSNSSYAENSWTSFPPAGELLRKDVLQTRQSLNLYRTHPLKSVLRKAILLMQDGLSSPDASLRLVRYWTALETLYSNELEKTSQEKVIRRATFAVNENRFDVWKLELLSEIRNDFIHSGKMRHETHPLQQFLRNLVSRHLLYLLHQGTDFNSHQEYLEMVDLPRQADRLLEIKRAIERRENLARTGRHKADN